MGAVTAQPAPIRWMIQALIDILDDAGMVVGDGVAPRGEDPTDLAKPPYVVVTFIGHGMLTGSMASFNQDVTLRMQTSAIGVTREQADWLRDQTRAVVGRDTYQAKLDTLLAASTEPNSEPRHVNRCEIAIAIPAERDERGLPEPVFMSRDQWFIEVVPVVSYAG
jgi:hypothetical protein